MSEQASIVTPEAVALEVDVAQLGSRSIAAVIDLTIQIAIVVVASFLILQISSGSTWGVIALLVVAFAVLWGYYPLLEGLWNGQTIGKRAQRIRVVRDDGQPVGGSPVIVRNLIRIPEEFMFPVVGITAIVVSKKAQRLGDHAAGTVVVRERAFAPPQALQPAQGGAPVLQRVDTTALGDRDYEVMRGFLLRRDGLEPAARATLAAEIAGRIRGRLSATGPLPADDERLIEVAAFAYRARFEAPPADAAAQS